MHGHGGDRGLAVQRLMSRPRLQLGCGRGRGGGRGDGRGSGHRGSQRLHVWGGCARHPGLQESAPAPVPPARDRHVVRLLSQHHWRPITTTAYASW